MIVLLIILNLYFCNFLTAEIDIIEHTQLLLNKGEFSKVEQLINEQPTTDLKNYIKSLYYLYFGSYSVCLEYLSLVKDINLQNKLKPYIEKLVEYKQNFDEYITEHFILRINKDEYFLKYYLSEYLDKIYYSLGSIFNYYPQEKIIIEIYPTKEQFAIASTLGEETLKRSGAIGICKFNRIMITSPKELAFGYRWIDTIAHEYVHFLINRITKFNCPLWLHEGIARYHETIWRKNPPDYLSPGDETMLKNAIKENKLISFSRMEPSLVYLNTQEEVSLAFAEVSSAIDFMSKEYPSKLYEILKKLEFYDRDTAFKKTIGLNIKQFEEKFKNYISKIELKQYKGALISKNYFEKLDELNEFVGVSVRDYVRLGDRFRKANNFDVALIQYKKAQELEPYNPVILYRLAKVYNELKEFELAEKTLKECIDKNSGYVSAYEFLGNFYLEQSKYQQAEEILKTALSINPFNPYTHKDLILVYSFLNKEEILKQEIEIFDFLNK